MADHNQNHWRPILGQDQADTVRTLVRDVATRLRDSERIQAANTAAVQQSAYPELAAWRPLSMANGDVGLALMCGYFDLCFPDEGWDRVGRQHLQVAAQALEVAENLEIGLYSGLCGLAFATWYLSRQGTRYQRLLASLDEALMPAINAAAEQLAASADGVGESEFDVISGLSGVGAYLLCRLDDDRCVAALRAVLRSLVVMTAEQPGLPRWHTPPTLALSAEMAHQYPHGHLNCGLSHGVPGPLTLMALAHLQGVTVPGMTASMGGIADWLSHYRLEDQWGVCWPTIVPLDVNEAEGAGDLFRPASPSALLPSRTAWCYGSPGVARALWLAGQALKVQAYCDLAIDAMQAVFRKPVGERRIDSPTFCHGVAGLLQITLRFAQDTRLAGFQEAADVLAAQLISLYEPDAILGFRSLEHDGQRVDSPGLLDGAAGVSLVLLAAISQVEPTWDRLFLLC